jgi:hypothetical protein
MPPPPIVETRLKISNVVGIFVGQAYLHIYTQARRVLVRKKCYEVVEGGGGGGGGGRRDNFFPIEFVGKILPLAPSLT